LEISVFNSSSNFIFSCFQVQLWSDKDVFEVFQNEHFEIAKVLKNNQIDGEALLEIADDNDLLKELFTLVGIRLQAKRLMKKGKP
jgi:hypothetical protein